MRLPKANKELGQHYLKDKKIIDLITSDFSDMAHTIIEVGPGPGVLTTPLSLLNKPMYAIEMDQRFEDILKNLKLKKIFFEDAMKFDWKKFWTSQTCTDPVWLVSNLPYNISSQLFIQFLYETRIKYLTLMFQKEVGEKINPPKQTKNPMNSLMALAQTFFKVKKLCIVPPGAFTPPPQVNSIVISFERKEFPAIEYAKLGSYEKFLRLLFQFKRKQIPKNLPSKYPKQRVLSALDAINVIPTHRAEALDLQQVQSLFKLLD